MNPLPQVLSACAKLAAHKHSSSDWGSSAKMLEDGGKSSPCASCVFVSRSAVTAEQYVQYRIITS